MQIFVNLYIGEKKTVILNLQEESILSCLNQEIENYARQNHNLDKSQYFCCQQSDNEWNLCLKLRGGKGGFGSLLRGQPPKKAMTKNFDACRDLSGRRLRNSANQQRLQQWQQKRAEQERIVQEEQKFSAQRKKQMELAQKASKYKLQSEFVRKGERVQKRVQKATRVGIKKSKKCTRQTLKKIQILDLLNSIEI